jgi:hypothetical protein
LHRIEWPALFPDGSCPPPPPTPHPTPPPRTTTTQPHTRCPPPQAPLFVFCSICLYLLPAKQQHARDGPNGCRGEGRGPGIAGSPLGWGETRREKQRCPGGTGCRAGKGRAAVWTSRLAEILSAIRHFCKETRVGGGPLHVSQGWSLVSMLQLRTLTAGCFVETRCPEPAEIA